MKNQERRRLLMLVVVVSTLAFAVFAFWARAQAIQSEKIFSIEKPRPETTVSARPVSGLENGLVPSVPDGKDERTKSSKKKKASSYPGIYVNKGPGDSLQVPKLQDIPVVEVDASSAFDFRRQLEELGLYLLAGLKTNDPAIRLDMTKAPSRLESIEKSVPKVSGAVRLRTVPSTAGTPLICIKGSSTKAGTWYYYVPEARFALFDSARCP